MADVLFTLKAIQYMPQYVYSHLFSTAQIIIRTPVGTSSNVTIMISPLSSSTPTSGVGIDNQQQSQS